MKQLSCPLLKGTPVTILRIFSVTLVVMALSACTSVESAPPTTTATADRLPSALMKADNTSGRTELASISDTSMSSTTTKKSTTRVSNDTSSNFRQTIVGRKIQQLRNDKEKIADFYAKYDARLKSLHASSESTARDYYSVMAMINSRLQAGTTPGNPILVEQSQTAQQKLEAIAGDITTLTTLSNDISTNASVASYLLEAVRATYGLSGAVDEDHVNLTELEDEVNRLVVQIDRQLTDVNNDINRRTSYLSTERRNLQTMTLAIANGELYGQSLANRAFFSPTNAMPGDPDMLAARATAASGVSAPNPNKPLVVIRFDRSNVDYEQAVYMATSEALQRFPNVGFEVVAVSPQGGNPAQASLASSDAENNAQNVARSMAQMGVPGSRLKMSATRSPMARSPEVHIFLR
jgi:hypothetical protein